LGRYSGALKTTVVLGRAALPGEVRGERPRILSMSVTTFLGAVAVTARIGMRGKRTRRRWSER